MITYEVICLKFVLNDCHRNVSDDELMKDLVSVAEQLQTDTLTIEQYLTKGKYHDSTIRRRFGSWRNALSIADLKNNRKNDPVSEDEIISDILRVANRMNKQTITTTEYSEFGKHSYPRIIKHFGSWANALQKAGLLSTGFVASLSDIEILEEIERIWILLGRQPTSNDIRNGISKVSLNSYARHFGSWRGALQAFVEWANDENNENEAQEESNVIAPEQSSIHQLTAETTHKTSRDINLRLRFRVMQRDSFKCRLCGASPAKDPSIELHIDHIKPWSKGGETTMDNLQTLCSKCNLGKSNFNDE